MKTLCILLAVLSFAFATSDNCDLGLSARNSCIFPPNGLYKCYDVANPSYITVSSEATLSYNNDCVNTATGESSGCSFDAQTNQLCVRAVPGAVYVWSFTATTECETEVPSKRDVVTATQSVTVTVPASNSECFVPNNCVNSCREDTCPGARYDLVTEDGTVAGYVVLKNKLNWEVSMEVVTFQGTIADRGWWITGLVFTIGEKRTVKDFAFGDEKSRWFEIISFSDAFPRDTIDCGASVKVLVVVQVTNDKRNHDRVQQRAYINGQPSKKSFTLPSDIDSKKVDYELCCECTIRTQSQNDWENLCTLVPSKRTDDNDRIREAVCKRDDIWYNTENWCFPNGIQVGCTSGHTVTFTSPFALAAYLADETTPVVLTQDAVDPPHASLGGLVAETAALALNLKLDECDSEWSTSCYQLRTLGVCQHPNNPSRTQCEPFWGFTVGEIFDLANSVLGGCTQGNAQELYTCVRYINRAFVDGKRLWQTPDMKPEGCGEVPSK